MNCPDPKIGLKTRFFAIFDDFAAKIGTWGPCSVQKLLGERSGPPALAVGPDSVSKMADFTDFVSFSGQFWPESAINWLVLDRFCQKWPKRAFWHVSSGQNAHPGPFELTVSQVQTL